jgi:6-pyruvoyltetrahydropterin/6-carboxytetrahydropterin synthase
MVLDFGFLKDEMMAHIDAVFDHAFIFWSEDPLCREMFGLENNELGRLVDESVRQIGSFAGRGRGGTKICVVPFVPTAESLAQYWFAALAPRVAQRSEGQARLVCIKVWETPNCWAAYGPEAGIA